jgi:hypothetical protein
MKFNSTIQKIGSFRKDWTQDEIKNEPMLFNCDGYTAFDLGSDITRNFLQRLILSGWDIKDTVVDSRVHMLMPGWYPCIPGMHHDDIPRSTTNGQPNYINPEYKAEHVLGLVNGDIAPTQFAIGDIDLEIPTEGIIYKEWHPKVMQTIEDGTMKSYSAESGVILQFDSESFHQGTKAVAGGWRWFIRVSKNTHRKPTNEIRKQVQVYLEHPMEGW